jgi:hypothetical protein
MWAPVSVVGATLKAGRVSDWWDPHVGQWIASFRAALLRNGAPRRAPPLSGAKPAPGLGLAGRKRSSRGGGGERDIKRRTQAWQRQR